MSTPRRRGNLARPFEETDVAQSATLESYAPVPLADAPECSVEYCDRPIYLDGVCKRHADLEAHRARRISR